MSDYIDTASFTLINDLLDRDHNSYFEDFSKGTYSSLACRCKSVISQRCKCGKKCYIHHDLDSHLHILECTYCKRVRDIVQYIEEDRNSDPKCRCASMQFQNCECGQNMFIHHKIHPKLHLLECAYCSRTRDVSLDQENPFKLTNKREPPEQFLQYLCINCGNSEKESFLDVTDADGLDVCKTCKKCGEIPVILSKKEQNQQQKIPQLQLVCNSCGNIDSDDFIDIEDISGTITHKKCGWCDAVIEMQNNSILIRSQKLVNSPCVCGNRDNGMFLYGFSETGILEVKQCQKNNCGKFMTLSDIGESTDVERKPHTIGEDKSEMPKVNLCLYCDNGDPNKYTVKIIEGEQPIIELLCHKCSKTSWIAEDDIPMTSEMQQIFESDVDSIDAESEFISLNNDSDCVDESPSRIECDCPQKEHQVIEYIKDIHGQVTNILCKACNCFAPIYNYIRGKNSAMCKGTCGYVVPKTQVRSVDELRPGDHICHFRPFGYWHHQIVVNVDHEAEIQNKILNKKRNNVTVIHYTNIGGQYSAEKLASMSLGKICKEKLYIDCSDDVYRIDYPKVECKNVKEVLEKAESLIGQKQYRLFSNNCENFARLCKTGRSESYQVKTIAKHLAKSVGNAVTGGIKSGVRYGIEKLATTGTRVAATGSRMAARLGPKALLSEIGGAITVVATETLFASYYIYKAYRQKKAGLISKTDFKNNVKQNVSRAGCSSFGAVVGGLLGSLIPIPIIGSLLGTGVGSILGGIFGTILGKKISN